MIGKIAAAVSFGDHARRAGRKPRDPREEEVFQVARNAVAQAAERGAVGGVDLILRGGQNVFCARKDHAFCRFVGGRRFERA